MYLSTTGFKSHSLWFNTARKWKLPFFLSKTFTLILISNKFWNESQKNQKLKSSKWLKLPQKIIPKKIFFFSLLSSLLCPVKPPLLDLTRQHRIASNGILIQLDLVVIFVMAQNLNAMVHKVIAWQPDTLLRSTKKQTKSGCISILQIEYFFSGVKTPSTDCNQKSCFVVNKAIW